MRLILSTAVAVTLALLAFRSVAEQRCGGFYNVAHMTNSVEAIKWAVMQGANGVEIDLDFTEDGDPSGFFHEGICDCWPRWRVGVCKHVRCDTRTPVKEIAIQVAASQPLALIILDAKVRGIRQGALDYAGGRVSAQVIREFRTKGYAGNIILGVSDLKHSPLLGGAFRDLREHAPELLPKVRFTIDGERGNAAHVVRRLKSLELPWVYGTGISSWVPIVYSGAVTEAQRLGAPFTYIWTIDSAGSMRLYLDDRVTAIMTNRPDVLRTEVRKRQLQLARPGDSFSCL